MATQEVPVIPHTLPAGYCFTTLQDLLDTFSAHQTVELPEGSTQIIVSESTPIPADQDKVWLKLDGTGDPVNFYWFNGGSWVEVNPPSVFWGIGSNVVDAYTVAVANPPPALVTGQLYLFKVPAANTGASTLQVNAFGAFAFNAGGVAIPAGGLKVNTYVGAIWTGTTFELLGGVKSSLVADLNPGTDRQVLRTVGTTPTWATLAVQVSIAVPTATAGGASVGAHGLGAAPDIESWYLVATAAQNGYAINDRIKLHDVTSQVGDAVYPAFSTYCDITNAYLNTYNPNGFWTFSDGSTGAQATIAVATFATQWTIVGYLIRV